MPCRGCAYLLLLHLAELSPFAAGSQRWPIPFSPRNAG
jgi:hypothetical protein